MTPLINNYYFIDDLPGNFKYDLYIRTGFIYSGPLSIRYPLPPGKWSIIGLSDEITEEQAWEISGHIGQTKYLQILLQSKGITKRVLILKKN